MILVVRESTDEEGATAEHLPFPTMGKAWEYVQEIVVNGDQDTNNLLLLVYASNGIAEWTHAKRDNGWLYGYHHYKPDHPRCWELASILGVKGGASTTHKRKKQRSMGFGS